MYKYILLDLDDTIFDFKKCEYISFINTLNKFNITITNDLYNKFNYYNELYFNTFAKGEIDRPTFHKLRFLSILPEYENIIKDINQLYIEELSLSSELFSDSILFLEEVSKKYQIFAATNGMTNVQRMRLKKANIDKYFSKVYISEDIGYHKPKKEFFDYIIKDINDYDKSHYIMIGDRIDSDIEGAINSNIDYILLDRLDKIKNKIYNKVVLNLESCIKLL